VNRPTVVISLVLTLAVLATACTGPKRVDLGVEGVNAQVWSQPIGGIDRNWLVATPEGHTAESDPIPLIVVLHGATGDIETVLNDTGFAEAAISHNIALVAPEGFQGGWNAGVCCLAPVEDDIDDIEFLSTVIDEVKDEIPISDVYMVGHSNGGMMAFRYACEKPEGITAFGSMAGTNADGCSVSEPITMLHVHSIDDGVVPFEGGQSALEFVGDLPPVQDEIEEVAAASNCSGLSGDQVPPATKLRGADCPAGIKVGLDILDGDSHNWPHDPYNATREFLGFWGLTPQP
jgi:polyhydroxybutyrate depolymerase